MISSASSQAASRPSFSPTRWSLVIRARGETPEARVALSELCETYWTPVFRFLQRDGRSEENARELAQEFFTRVLSGNAPLVADPDRGRFRSYLLGAVKHFLSDRREREGRLKRGGALSPEALDTETGLEIRDMNAIAPDALFDREWALSIMARALETVEREFAAAGRSAQFAAFKPWLAGGGEASAQSAAGVALGMSDGAVKVAIHRLRKRFRDAVRAEVAQTLPEGGDPADELRYLVDVLARG